jgi:hypothetical protein
MRSFLLITALIALIEASPAVAAQRGDLDELSAYLTLESFSWKEFLDDQRVLKESGPLVGAGGVAAVVIATPENGSLVLLRGRGEIAGGDVDYDGQTSSSAPLPVHSDTTYLMLKGEGELGWRFPLARSSLEPFAGIGYRWWRRDISDSFTVVNGSVVVVNGGLELWESLYTRTGIRATHELDANVRLFAEAGGKFAFLNHNTAKDQSIGEPTLRPGEGWSAFGGIGAQFGRFRPELFYEGFRFGQSPAIVNGNIRVFQPESTEDVYGVRLGWAFR